MANFNFSLENILNGSTINRRVISGQKNYTPDGRPRALRTSESLEPEPAKGITTANISDILQGQVLYKDTGFITSQFNEVLSTDMAKLLNLKISGKKIGISRANANLLGYDIRSAIVAEESLSGGFSSGTSAPGNAPGSPTVPVRATPGGFVFPISSTKSVIRTGVNGSSWNSTNVNNYHHSYNAADIIVPTGTVVVAAMGGKVISANNNGGNYGSSVRIEGRDGYWYYYVHLGANTLRVSVGQQVNPGDQLGLVGTSAEAQNTIPHLHFDISPQENGFARGYGFANGPLINPQPWLIEAFQLLPE